MECIRQPVVRTRTITTNPHRHMHGAGAKQTVISTLIEYWKTHSPATAGHMDYRGKWDWLEAAGCHPPLPTWTDTKSGSDRDGLTLLRIWYEFVACADIEIEDADDKLLSRRGGFTHIVSKVLQSRKNALVFPSPGVFGGGPRQLGSTAQFHPRAAAKAPAQ